MDNYQAVLHQMEAFGIALREGKDLPLRIDTPRKRTCGQGGKYWYRLYTWRPDAGGCYITGSFGSYKSGQWEKVELDLAPLSEAERTRRQQQRDAAAQRAAQARAAEVAEAALTAAELWRRGAQQGTSAYLTRKGVEGEACRYMPDGSILVPLLRYDLPRADALRGLQRIYGGPRKCRRTGEALPEKTFTKGFDKPGAALRLGLVVAGEPILVCEGYATGLSLRMALGRRLPVFVALDAGNLAAVVAMLQKVWPGHLVLVCADDDWQTKDHRGRPDNVGRRKAAEVAKAYPNVWVVYPAFGAKRGAKDTDFNDLHRLQGLPAVARQLHWVLAFAQQEAA